MSHEQARNHSNSGAYRASPGCQKAGQRAETRAMLAEILQRSGGIEFSYFFASSIFRAQVATCAFFSILLGITILAILELAYPYLGDVTISDGPLRRALSRMKEAGNNKI
jgi:hypothetical protein